MLREHEALLRLTGKDKNSPDELRCVLPSFISDRCALVQDSDSRRNLGGGYLVGEIGLSVTAAEALSDFETVFGCLRTLHLNGVVHGDPRLPNLLKKPVGSKSYFWIDFMRIRDVNALVEDNGSQYVHDVFLSSNPVLADILTGHQQKL